MDLVIFDCDGVLIDSEILWATIEAAALTETGFPISAMEYATRYAGLTHQIINKLIETEHGFAVRADHAQRVGAMFEQRLPLDLKVVPGAAQMIASVGGKRCIASNSMLDYLDRTLALTGLRHLFTDNIYSARECGNRQTKPDPNVFLHALATMDAAPERSVIVEDSIHGVEAACAAGVRYVIGFGGASHMAAGYEARLRGAGATHVAKNMPDLAKLLGELGVTQP
jgi:HAD superfamily hydrolase (TIGR01509 family)